MPFEGAAPLAGSPARWRALHRFCANRVAVAGAALILLLVTVAVFANRVAPHEAREQLYFTEGAEVCEQSAPSTGHWFGVDSACRDTFSRVVHGSRISLSIAVVTQALAVSIGLVVGGAAGLGGRWLDGLLMRLTDAAYAFPDLLLIILLASVFRESWLGRAGGGVAAIILAVSLTSWVTIARLVRGQVLSLKGQEFVLAARAQGASERRILFRHLLPQTLGPVVVAATFSVPSAIFAEATLSYIGIGVRPPTPSWGVLVNEGYTVMLASYWPVLIPALAIAVTMLAFTLLGDGLRDALHPRTPR